MENLRFMKYKNLNKFLHFFITKGNTIKLYHIHVLNRTVDREFQQFLALLLMLRAKNACLHYTSLK